jgi:hypothetical protein
MSRDSGTAALTAAIIDVAALRETDAAAGLR